MTVLNLMPECAIEVPRDRAWKNAYECLSRPCHGVSSWDDGRYRERAISGDREVQMEKKDWRQRIGSVLVLVIFVTSLSCFGE